MARQTPIFGVPFPVCVSDTDTSQRIVFDSLVDLTASINGNANITGISVSCLIGTESVEVDETLTGISATAAVGTLTDSVSVTLSGISTSGALGTMTVTGDAATTITGIVATPAVGTTTETVDANVTLTGIAATPAIADVSDWVQEFLTGISASAGIGTVIASVDSNVQLFSGITGYPSLGTLLTIIRPTIEYATIDGIESSSALGTVTPASGIPLTGIASSARIGTIAPITTASGMGFTELDATTEMVPPSNISLNLRWSDDRGASWAGARNTQFGAMGAYLTSLQFRRMGMARDRIYEVSWTAPIPTALVGMNLQVEDAAT